MSSKSLVFTLLFAVSAHAAASGESLEPCINGEVSASGNFPTQQMEDQVFAYLDWRNKDPYYLFRVAAAKLRTAYSEN